MPRSKAEITTLQLAVGTGDPVDHGAENNTWCLAMLHFVFVCCFCYDFYHFLLSSRL